MIRTTTTRFVINNVVRRSSSCINSRPLQLQHSLQKFISMIPQHQQVGNNNNTSVVRWSSTTTTNEVSSVKKTALYDFHLSMGGDMVPFAGYQLPIMYKPHNNDIITKSGGGIINEHIWCRTNASIFDVSHMGQIIFRGNDRIKFLESLVVGDVGGLSIGNSCLSLLTHPHGGIMDDTVITNTGDYIYMVINGATKITDLQHIQEQIQSFSGDVTLDVLDESHELIALQGPAAIKVISPLLPSNFDLAKMKFMSSTEINIHNVDCRMTRCGYTGEDGFELSIPADKVVDITSMLLEQPLVDMAGLGARDSLRLEAGLCLYGHDIDHTINPIEAGLGWTLGPPNSRRRIEQGFLGAEHILTPEGKFKPVTQKRVGIIGMKAPAREGALIYNSDGSKEIGKVTSGTFSPTLKKPIAMGYVQTEYTKVDTSIQVKIRDKLHSAAVTKMPFVPSNYYRIPE